MSGRGLSGKKGGKIEFLYHGKDGRGTVFLTPLAIAACRIPGRACACTRPSSGSIHPSTAAERLFCRHHALE